MKINRLVAITAFLFGYAISDVVNNVNNGFLSEVSAEVDGMTFSDLRRDRDFKKAVKYLVEESWRDYNFESVVRNVVDSDCSVNVDGGYVSGDYIYGMHGYISC